MSQQLVKVLGLGQRDFPAETEFVGGMQPSLPTQLEFYVCMNCVDADTTVHKSKLMPVIFQSASPGEYVNYVNHYPDTIHWCKMNKRSISRITVAMYYVDGGQLVHCEPFLDRWTLVIMYKRRSPVALHPVS